MSAETWAAVDTYLEPLVGEDEALRAANHRAREAGLPAIQVSAAQGKLLHLVAQLHGSQRALEVGTLGGYSTIWLARGLQGPGRHVTTIEVDPRHADVARENLDRAGLADVVEVRVGKGVDVLASLVADDVAPYDLVFIDADKPSNVAYLEAALELTRPGAVIVVDNVVRAGALADPQDDERVQGSRAVVERAAQDARLSGTVVQTVGSKGYDGFLLLRRLA
ncbi:O-methyltransferase [Cellulomonas sp. APG4]|uniref:O-methyltransferase n=1 Tax=Cellulomonas sp. APG4 TaxID=1538656 RepID=UPI00137B68ED|nr:O-methyltransferase [Cellulomonas sp. APG4]NCT89773.1 O-methyltransferase [Cellulomonas sp. APG4]